MGLRRILLTAIAASFLSEAAIAGPVTIDQPNTVSKTQSGYAGTQRKGPPLPPIGPGRKSQDVVRYPAASEFLMFKGVRPADKPEAYDARITQSNLQWRIVRR